MYPRSIQIVKLLECLVHTFIENVKYQTNVNKNDYQLLQDLTFPERST